MFNLFNRWKMGFKYFETSGLVIFILTIFVRVICKTHHALFFRFQNYLMKVLSLARIQYV